MQIRLINRAPILDGQMTEHSIQQAKNLIFSR